MKYENKLPPLALAILLAACAGGNDDNANLRQLSNGPDLPEACSICWVDFEACVEAGVDIELCEDAAVGCAEICNAPPPPPHCDHCFAGYEACIDVAKQGMADVTDCVTGLESCLQSCEGDEPEPPICEVVGDIGQCWDTCEDYCSDRCFSEDPEQPAGDAAACTSEMYKECIQECDDVVVVPPEPPCYPDEATGYCYDEDFCANECTGCLDDGESEYGVCEDNVQALCVERCPVATL